ncbi:MAG: hypothetical protein A2V57_01185 [Candidatus Aminicenantes bacterium RBG_19FT_COMBO_65_30]|nr:MAG: hypothetical protein A2V57_01185 [Candidatus Aminicenantes bacterium RBG_19FT_COMBO_65_30]
MAGVDEIRRVEYVPLGDVQPATSNPKRHDVPRIARSIVRFGFTTPGLRDERTGRIVVGHGRVEALIALRDDPALLARLRTECESTATGPPAGVMVGDDGDWLVPLVVGWESRDDAEAAAYLVADNRHTELGGWDHGELASLLDDIGDPALVDVIGWDLDDLAEPLDTVDGMPGDDAGDPTPTDPTLEVVVTCRDELDRDDLMRRLSGEGYRVRIP